MLPRRGERLSVSQDMVGGEKEKMTCCIAMGIALDNSQRLSLELLALQDRTWLSSWEAQASATCLAYTLSKFAS